MCRCIVKLIKVSALKDNYIWFLYNHNNECIIIDAGDHIPVLNTINKLQLSPVAFLLTHHHYDHVGGIKKLIQYYSVPVYGPKETSNQGTNRVVDENDKLILLNHTFDILALPGHTMGHIGFYSKPWLFCGDTMFSAGCGRIFEGTYKQMYTSLQKINNLPSDTLICTAHEYTLTNINFAVSILPGDKIINSYHRRIIKLRLNNQSTVPTTLNLERQINIFLRCNDINLQKSLYYNCPPEEEWLIFTKLRNKKDNFQLN